MGKMRGLGLALCGIMAVLAVSNAQGVAFAQNQLTTSALGEDSQRALFQQPENSFLLPVATGTNTVLDNAAGRIILSDVSAFPFLATLPNNGIATFIAALKPCGLLNIHVHPRASEQYLVLSGQMTGGIAQEVTAKNATSTFKINPGQIMLVPQGLMHYNQNDNCSPLVFTIGYNSADPGTVALNPALSGLTTANAQAAAAGNFTSELGDLGPFALDQTCLKTCGLPSTGSPNGLSGLSAEMQALLGIASSPSNSPPRPPSSG